ncbi:WbuC family cupin fold metalloprotein [Pseudoalteromonas luteoviolacea]|uniref:Cupin fold metalloprotein WbuC cupin domain-containing protein n=1 Tax=Pseudoalteromonas luteoviolacea NCIMB 1942 TaxID=1365253 RepID=A0A167GET1_9GAMM|nr:WbuC family cupin fold metalloprotein [Pseudoalteromonas luteoviolacea]KZN54991.1 hypothetical protein N482_05395 [Pseudoalteromonas luteoviolacea NCIMB 1942]
MSNAIYIDGPIKVISRVQINELKEKAIKSNNGRYRYCLHNSIDDDVQNMIIAITSDTQLLPQRRIGSDKSFSIIEGELRIVVFSEEGQVLKVVNLTAEDNQSLWISDKYYTLTLPLSTVAVYQEVITGRFDNQNDHPSWNVDAQLLHSLTS